MLEFFSTIFSIIFSASGFGNLPKISLTIFRSVLPAKSGSLSPNDGTKPLIIWSAFSPDGIPFKNSNRVPKSPEPEILDVIAFTIPSTSNLSAGILFRISLKKFRSKLPFILPITCLRISVLPERSVPGFTRLRTLPKASITP